MTIEVRYLGNGINYPVPQAIVVPQVFTFNGGEPHVKFDRFDFMAGECTIDAQIRSADDFMELLLATDALRRLGMERINLNIPYFPGARQDRVMVQGEPLTVKVYADIINAQNYNKVTVFDPHSDVTPALIDRCVSCVNHGFVCEVVKALMPVNGYYIVSPDAGSLKKAHALGAYLSINTSYEFLGVVECSKTRDVKTGKLTDFKVSSSLMLSHEADFMVVDDICDGGRTFIGLAERLMEAGALDLHLVVSHGIFSKGAEELFKSYKTIWTTDSFFPPDAIKPKDFNVIKLREIE